MTALLRALLEMTAAASVMIGVVLAIRFGLSRKMNPAVMVALWGLVLLRLCLPFTIASPVHLDGLLPEQAAAVRGSAVSQTPPAADPAVRPVSQAARREPAVNAPGLPAGEPAARPAAAEPTVSERIGAFLKSIPIWDALTALWAAGALSVLLWTAGKARLFRRKLRICRPVADEGILRVIRRYEKSLGIKRGVAALECDFVEAPTVFGCLKPVILLPAQFVHRMGRQKLDSILLHELCHIKRRDLLFNTIWLLAKAAHWFNPLVWAAYRCFQSDVELSRDQMVVRRLEGGSRLDYGQSLIDSARYAKRARNSMPFVAASLFESKSRVKDRVIRLVEPQKRSRVSFIASVVLAMLMLVSCFTTACQPTPTKPVVVNKGDGKLEEIIRSTPAPAETARLYQAPEALKYTLEGAKGFRVDVDAPVTLPDVAAFPVVSVRKDTITQEQADRIVKALLGGQTLYKPTDALNKAQIQTILDYYQRELEASDTKELRDTYQQTLKDWMKKYEAAPDTVPLEPAGTTLAFHEDDRDLLLRYGAVEVKGNTKTTGWTEEGRRRAQADGYKLITGVTAFDPTKRQMHLTIRVHNPDLEDDYPGQGVWFEVRDNISGMNTMPEEVRRLNADKLTMAQATAQAQAVIDTTGLPFSLVSAQAMQPESIPGIDMPASSWYEFIFKPDVGAIPQAQVAPAHLPGMEEYAQPYEGENIYIMLDNQGIVQFNWTGPSRFVATENENVPLLPFEQAQAIFDKQIVLQNQWYSTEYDPDVVSRRMEIDCVILSAMPIRKADEPGGYRYVPVWDFCGRLYARYGDDYPKNQGGHYILDENNERIELGAENTWGGTNISFLTINAIDGTVIDRNRGY